MLPVGLELAAALWAEQAGPRLARELPGAAGLVAAGLAGEGSECFGFDDPISRDHDWGPALCFWVRRQDLAALRAPLEELLGGLPDPFHGLPLRRPGPEAAGRTGVLEVEGFFRRFTGLERPPETAREWLRVPEHALAACSNGRVFADPCGAFSRHRERLLAHYPEPVRRLKLAASLEAAAQAGQYNLARCLRRGDRVASTLAEAAFLRHAMGACFLLSRRYRPFDKWMHRALRLLDPPGPRIALELDALVREPEDAGRLRRVEAVAGVLAEALAGQGLTTSHDGFLLAHARELRAGLDDPGLLGLDPGTDR